MGRTDGERVDFLPNVFHGKKLRFTGRGGQVRHQRIQAHLGKLNE